MKSYKLSPNQTGWMSISGDTAFIVAHYKDGHTEMMELMEYVACPKKRKSVIQVDCYTEEERQLVKI